MSNNSIFPFVYREGIAAKYIARKRTAPFGNIRVMFEKQMLDETDTNILLHLQKYVYLNAYLIKTLLSRQLAECTTEFCNTHLKQLEKLGFVTRFQFLYTDKSNKEHSTPFVYTLTANARKIFPVKNDESFNTIMDIDCVQRRLSFNQFHIMLEGQYGSTLLYSSYLFGREYDGLYKVMSNGKPIIFYVFSIRQGEDWEKQYLRRIRGFKDYITESGVSYSGLIVICESEYQSLKAERCRYGDREIVSLDVYYVCDYAAVAEGALLQHIIQVDSNNNSYDILRIPVDGAVKENVKVDIS